MFILFLDNFLFLFFSSFLFYAFPLSLCSLLSTYFFFYLFLFSLLFIYRLRLHVPSFFLFLALYTFNTAPLSFTAPFVLLCWHRHLCSRDMTIKIFLIYWLLPWLVTPLFGTLLVIQQPGLDPKGNKFSILNLIIK